MATRAFEDLRNAIIKNYAVTNGYTTVAGTRVVFGASDDLIDVAAANDDLAIGTVQEAVVGDGVKRANVCLDFFAIVKMLVGTGGSTRGKKQAALTASGGITDAGTAGVTTAQGICGVALQSGVAGDFIAVGILNGRGPHT